MSRVTRPAGPPRSCCRPVPVLVFRDQTPVALYAQHHCGAGRITQDLRTWLAAR